MSKSPQPVPANPPSPPVPAAKGGAVIRRVEAAQETAQERLLRKHLPAWVISGAVHVALVALLLLLAGQPTQTNASEKVIATSVEKEETEPQDNLTNEDIGLDANLESALPDKERVDERTVDEVVTTDPLGKPDVPDLDRNAFDLVGIPSLEANTPGLAGLEGNALSGGGNYGNMMSSFAGRSGATKSQMLREGGGTDQSEAAVGRGLAWLAKQQRTDGSWIFDEGRKNEVIAATGLALAAFLGAGETHKHAKKYRANVERGLQYLMRNCPVSGPNAGKFIGAQTMYAQAIGTLALCEAYGMTKDPALKPYAQAAINFIIRAQAADGSWGYSPNSPGDTSIVGWQIQALQAARLSKDIVVDPRCIKKAIEFLDKVGAGSRKTMYGYNQAAGAAPGTALTAVGLLCRYYVDGWGPDNAAMAEGVQGLLQRNPPRYSSKALGNMYYYYYATQVVHFFEGEAWKTWNEGPKDPQTGKRTGGMRDWLINLQVTKDGPNYGSWDPDNSWMGRETGRLGTTAMCVMTLEVYYRHMPLYKRAAAGDARFLEVAK
ncbi:MAG: prenyltransferase/squalene oxidase repeat-containing protein [Thermogemmata sp.]|jgi:hypothetical protein